MLAPISTAIDGIGKAPIQVGHGELLHDFYGLIEQNVLDYFKDVTPGTLGDKCSSYKTMLGRDYNFTETDKTSL